MDSVTSMGKSNSSDLTELPRPPQLGTSTGTRQGVLAVQDIDFCIKENGENHHTSKFSLMTRDKCLVVRRGQSFKLDILLNRTYDATNDAISFIFNVSDEKERVPLLEKGSETSVSWNAVYDGQMDRHLMVSVTPAADCMVALWEVDIETKLIGGSSLSYPHPLTIYVLFNPWCLTDTVYMAGQDHREEFVEQDSGFIFNGTYNNVVPWYYAQYEKDILECALHLVTEIGKVKGKARGDAIRTCRALSAAINVEDDNGALVGKWDKKNDYTGGTKPLDWVGSKIILQEYYKKKEPMKFVQCWIFAGVMTTICRALGIPCRPVTGFKVAYDSQGSLTYDVVVDENGEEVPDFCKDKEWNFHVWNEVWMERQDLGPEYGGWQAVDATPQAISDGMSRCGPASLHAVREGEVQRPYDCSFIFAQVNADVVVWKYSGKNQPLKFLKRDTTYIGQHISTKAIGAMKREDITHLYKYPEGTRQERETVEKVLRKSESIFARDYLNEDFNDVRFDFELRDDIKIGQDFTVVVHIDNHSSVSSHQVKGVLRVDTVRYGGKTGDSVKKFDFNFNLAPHAKELVTMLVTFDEYYSKLVDQDSFKIACMASFVDKQFDYFAQDDFRVQNPDIKVTIDGKPKCRQECNVTVQVNNPLPIPLKNAKFYIEGPGLESQMEIELTENVAPGAVAKAEFKLTPPWAGQQQISAKFSSKEMTNVNGFLGYIVEVPDNHSSDALETSQP